MSEDRERTLSAHRGPPGLVATIGDTRPQSIRRTAHLWQARTGRDPEGPRLVAPTGPTELATANCSRILIRRTRRIPFPRRWVNRSSGHRKRGRSRSGRRSSGPLDGVSMSRASCRAFLPYAGAGLGRHRHPGGGGAMIDQLERQVRAGVGEQPPALADDHGAVNGVISSTRSLSSSNRTRLRPPTTCSSPPAWLARRRRPRRLRRGRSCPPTSGR